MVVRISDKKKNYGKVTKLLVKPIINIWTQLIIQTFQLKLIRLIQEAGGLKKPEERTDSIKITLKDSMSMPSSNPLTMIPKIVKIFKAG